MSDVLNRHFEEYMWFGPRSGKIKQILADPDFLPYGDLARNFFLYGCTQNGPDNTLSPTKDSASVQAWLGAAEEFERYALRPRNDVRTCPNPAPQLRETFFTVDDATRWASNGINVGYKIYEKFPDHPVVSWLRSKECAQYWHAPQDGFLTSLYRKATITEKRRLILDEIQARNAKSDAMLYVFFRIYAEQHCMPNSPAWKIAVDEVGKATNFGTAFKIPANEWASFRDRTIKAIHS